jgi:Ferritin-like domain
MQQSSAPPRRPTDADVALIATVQGYELAARELYATARRSIDWAAADSDEQGWADVIDVFHDAHEAYAAAFSAMLGRDAPNARDQALVDERSADFSTDAAAALEAMYTLEADLVVTYNELLGELEGIDAAITVASIITAEARHGTVLANMLGKSSADDLDDLLVSNTGTALPLAQEG